MHWLPTNLRRAKSPPKNFRATNGAPPLVDVSHNAEKRVWILQGKKHAVELNEKTLALKIQAGPTVWSMVPSGANDMLIKSGDDEFPMSLADAGRIDIVPYDAAFKTGVKIKLDDWPGKSGRINLSLYLTVALEGPDDELVFDIAADEREAKVRRLDWPTALDAARSISPSSPTAAGRCCRATGRSGITPFAQRRTKRPRCRVM